ncbi:MAG: glycosyltransferase family 2 protein [bacterium]|nr:glycosyltransferase family 2 protein [bacterium]
MRDVLMFCDKKGYYGFLKPYLDSYVGDSRYQFVVERSESKERLLEYFGKDCTIWLDHLNEFAIWASSLQNNGKTKLVCRVQGTELLDVDLQNCRWEAFDAVVTSNHSSEAVLFDAVDRLESMAAYSLIPPAAQVTPLSVAQKVRTKNIAYLSDIDHESNSLVILDVLSELVRVDKEYKLYVVGDFATTSLRVHFEHMIAAMQLSENIEFHQRPDNLAIWLKDKSYILSTAIAAGNEAEIALAMTLGVQPVVINHFGAESLTDSAELVNCVSGCVNKLLQEPGDPSQLRQKALETSNVDMYRGQFEEVLNGADFAYEPKVSILLPTYNRAEMLKRALARLAQQTYSNREIVVINDCSSDTTESVVLEAMKTRSDIVYHRNDVNLGNAGSMAMAAAKSSGDFVLSFSDDDDLDNRALEEFVSYWRRKKSDIIYSDLAVTDSTGRETAQWKYRNYYSNYELLNELVFADGNKIPEVFFCRRELYDQVYTQTYTRRFLNTYYLPHLRKLKMIHLPKMLCRYAVHVGSTFGNVVGLFDRSKSTQNYVNAAMFMYAPGRVMNIPNDRPASQQIADAYACVASVLIEHGKRRISGKMYTGVSYEEKDNLHWLYFYNAFHWLKMAQRYGLPEEHARKIENQILETIDPAGFNPRKHANMPDVYRELPWFANKAFNNLSKFVAFDCVSLGAPEWMAKRSYSVYKDGKAEIEVCNHLCKSQDEFETVMRRTSVTVVNIFDASSVESTIRYLIENQLSSVHVFNFSRVRVPEIELLKTVFNVGPGAVRSFADYLKLVTQISTASHYEYCAVEATV